MEINTTSDIFNISNEIQSSEVGKCGISVEDVISSTSIKHVSNDGPNNYFLLAFNNFHFQIKMDLFLIYFNTSFLPFTIRLFIHFIRSKHFLNFVDKFH